MNKITASSMRTMLASVLAVVGLLGLQAPALATTPAETRTPVVAQQSEAAQNRCGDLSGYEWVALSELPPEATETVRLILRGGPYPYPEDGGVFHNREGLLPDCPDGYYREYTVETPGIDHRGARRFVVGADGEFFYTADHYESFRLTDIHA